MSPATRDLSERLIAIERDAPVVAEEDRFATCRVCEKLRRPLSHLVGAAGVKSLMQRALALAQRESPLLGAVHVVGDGSLNGLEGEAAEASPVLIAHLIELLITFIGQGLTFRLLADIWPEMKDLSESTGEGGYEQ